MKCFLFRFCELFIFLVIICGGTISESVAGEIRIMPIGDSITRGAYLVYTGLPNKKGGGWRKLLQDKLQKKGITYEFVGELDYFSYGDHGVVDPNFSPNHHGLAGFSCRKILNGGVVPSPQDILRKKGIKQIKVPGVVAAIKHNKPNIILLMAGSNGLNSKDRDILIKTILDHFNGELFVATIPPQKAPRPGWKSVVKFNKSLPGVINKLHYRHKNLFLVDMYSAMNGSDILKDGVHPNQQGNVKIADTWYRAMVKNSRLINHSGHSE